MASLVKAEGLIRFIKIYLLFYLGSGETPLLLFFNPLKFVGTCLGAELVPQS